MSSLYSRLLKRLPFLVILFALAAGVLWWQRTPLLSWCYFQGLMQADETDLPIWADRVASLDSDAVPGLVELLRVDDARLCRNGEAALSALFKLWGPGDARTSALASELTIGFKSLSPPGRDAALEWFLVVLHDPHAQKKTCQQLNQVAARILSLAARFEDKGMRIRTLALAEVLLGRAGSPDTELCRNLAMEGMQCPDAEVRARAVRLVMHAPLNAEKPLVDSVLPFLKDGSPEVRRAAVLAVGLAEETIGVQEMLPLLHDTDSEVCRLCEVALRGRGLLDTHIKLAKLISDQRPGQRLQVVQRLSDADDLDPSLWLMHLSEDSSPAVRAAAIRFAAEDPAAVDFQYRMVQMSRDDPSPTVRQLAVFYLKTYKPH